jgi:hypothetical protein
MDQLFRRLLEDNFSDLPGLAADVSIPVPEHLVNEIINVAIRESRNISYCRASISRNNRASVNLKTPLWPWPLELKLRLENSMDFPVSPQIRARLENKVLLARIGSFLKALPAWVSIHGDQVDLDVSSFLPPEQRRFLELVKSVEVKTEEGKVIFNVRIANAGAK